MVGELVRKSGNVQRDFSAQRQSWKQAELGTEFRLGDGLWLRGAGESAIRLQGGQQLEMQADTILRFGAVELGSGQFEVSEGEAVLTVGSSPYTLTTQFGVAQIEGRSRIVLKNDDGRQQVHVALGGARFEVDGQEQVVARVGDAVIMGARGVEVVKVSDFAAPSGARAATPERSSSAAAIVDAVVNSFSVTLKSAGAKVKRAGASEFVALPIGEHGLPVGAVLRLPKNVGAVVARDGEVVEARGAGDFELGGATNPELTTASGRLQVRTSDRKVTIHVPGGAIVVDAPTGGSVATLAVNGGKTALTVARGRARIQPADGEVEVVESGEKATLGVERSNGEDRALLGEEGPKLADLTVPAGKTFSVHSPTVPVVVGFDAGTLCPGEAVIKSGRLMVRGRGQVNASLRSGRHRYSLHCVSRGKLVRKKAAKGVVTVLRDSGNRQLPKAAPATAVETDGRRYTVIYQNQPPYITAHWSGAPQAARYVLKVKSGRRTKSYKVDEAKFTFRSGSLRDGVHELLFSTAGGRSAKLTTLELRFDHVAPKASVRKPKDRSFRPGASVEVTGVVLPGWKVAVEGGTIQMDRQWRFTGVVKTTTSSPNVVLRLSHPRQGVHYYLRRAAF